MKWPLLPLFAACSLLVACTGDTASTSTKAQTTSTTSTVPTTSTTTTSVATTTTLSDTQVCLTYRNELLPIIQEVATELEQGSEVFFDAADGLVSTDELASVSLLTSDRFGQAVEEIGFLGEAPPVLAESVRLFIRGTERLEEAFETAARGANLDSVPLLEEAAAAILEGSTFLGAANDALPSSC